MAVIPSSIPTKYRFKKLMPYLRAKIQEITTVDPAQLENVQITINPTAGTILLTFDPTIRWTNQKNTELIHYQPITLVQLMDHLGYQGKTFHAYQKADIEKALPSELIKTDIEDPSGLKITLPVQGKINWHDDEITTVALFTQGEEYIIPLSKERVDLGGMRVTKEDNANPLTLTVLDYLEPVNPTDPENDI